jgi:hypothetical protein
MIQPTRGTVGADFVNGLFLKMAGRDLGEEVSGVKYVFATLIANFGFFRLALALHSMILVPKVIKGGTYEHSCR